MTAAPVEENVRGMLRPTMIPLACWLALVSCGGGGGDGDADTDTDVDTDSDGDTDVDTDSDIDTDSDVDTDSDADGDQDADDDVTDGDLDAEIDGDPDGSTDADADSDGDADGDAVCGDPEVLARYPACRAADDEASCLAAGGTWTRIGLSPVEACQCPTGQGGCPCDRRTDCLTACIAPTTGGVFACDGVTVGSCSPVGITVGCWCFFDAEGNVEGICVD
jgi:hypothetical protein